MALVSLMLAGCAGGTTIPGMAPHGTAISGSATDGFAADGFPTGGNVYVGSIPSQGSAGSIAVYSSLGATKVATIAKGVGVPSAMTFNKQGLLYVANQKPFASSSKYCASTGSVKAYPAGSMNYRVATAKGTVCPLAVGYAKALYVLNANKSVTVYSVTKKKITLLRTVRNGVASPVAMAVDSSGNFYVANDTGTSKSPSGNVVAYRYGSSVPAYKIGFSQRWPIALATDSSGHLYVGTAATYVNTSAQKACANEYAPLSKKLVQQFCGGNVMSSIVVDSSNNIYLAAYSASSSSSGSVAYGGQVAVFSQSGKKLRTIAMIAPRAMALDSKANLYVVDCGAYGCGTNSSSSSSGPVVRVVAAGGSSVVRNITISGQYWSLSAY